MFRAFRGWSHFKVELPSLFGGTTKDIFFFIHFRMRSHTPKLKLFNVPSTQIKITVDFSMRPDPWVGNLVWDLKIESLFCSLAFCKNRHKLGHNRWFITKTQANNVLNTFTNRHYTAALVALFCKLLRDPSSFCLVIPPSLGCFLHPHVQGGLSPHLHSKQ